VDIVNKSRRNFYVVMVLAGVLTGTSVLLLALAPSPLQPSAWNVLAAVDDPRSLEAIFKTQNRIQPGRWKYIYIHQSKTAGGNAMNFSKPSDGWGDHFLIGNGDGCGDGEIQAGQRWNQQMSALPPAGAGSIHPACVSICVVGDLDRMKPTAMQMKRLTQLVNALQDRLRVPPAGVLMIESDSTVGMGKYFPAAEVKERLLP
jgi:hypothetical protein